MTQKNYKYAVVDLEATAGNNDAKIIQVGIVLIENGRITDTYQTDVNPHESLSEHIKFLTGISDRRLAQAPDFSQVAPQIYDLIHDAVFVAHNVKFDANLLAESLFWEGFELRTPRVDTVELAQVFFPFFEKYNLGILCQYLDIQLDKAHTAISDALATAELFLKIQEKIRTLPKSLVEKILLYADSLIYESRLAIEEVFQSQASPYARKDLIERQGIFLRKSKQLGAERKLSEDFSRNIALLGLDKRELQQQFAHFMEQALDNQIPSFLQAQSGLGKTYAYLLPLLARTDDKILITVPTKILQRQLMAAEGKAIEQVFQISFHSLKSPSAYLKLDSFYHSLGKIEDNHLINRCKMKLLVWLTETQTGDLDEIGQRHRYQVYLDEIGHDGQLSRKSLFYGEDFWQISQAKARTSRVLITNHAYFLTRLEDDKGLLDGCRVVIDEAQSLFLALESFSRKSLNMTKTMQIIHQEITQAESLLERRLLESLQFELAAAVEQFHSNQRQKKVELDQKLIEKLRQDLSELKSRALIELQEIVNTRHAQIWLEDEYWEDHRITNMQAARFDFLNIREFLPDTSKLYLISATLEISPKVNLAGLLGFKEYKFYTLTSQNMQQQQIWLDQDFPNVADLSTKDYARLIAERIEGLASLNISQLVLFTSKELLLATSECLLLPHLAQYRNGDAASIKRRFDKGEVRVLLGTGSFWEGTDFASQDQMIEIITRLPFDNPSDFFTQKMNRHLRSEDKNPFYDYSLPIAVLRLKQALGRTVRHPQQQSAVLILDNRVYSKPYSQQIESALLDLAPIQRVSMKEVKSGMQDFFSKSRGEAEKEAHVAKNGNRTNISK